MKTNRTFNFFVHDNIQWLLLLATAIYTYSKYLKNSTLWNWIPFVCFCIEITFHLIYFYKYRETKYKNNRLSIYLHELCTLVLTAVILIKIYTNLNPLYLFGNLLIIYIATLLLSVLFCNESNIRKLAFQMSIYIVISYLLLSTVIYT